MQRGYTSDMSTISLQDVARDPLGCLRRVERGEALLVMSEGRPVAELRPVPQPNPQPRPFGLAQGQFTTPTDFDAPLPEEVMQGFEGR